MVVGNYNLAWIQDVFQRRVTGDERVKIEAKPRKCIVDFKATAGEVVWDNMRSRNFVVIYADVRNVIKKRSQNLGNQLEKGVNNLIKISE